MKKSILFLTALALITINSAFDFGNDPMDQKFKKMTIMYRDFQGGNKNIYKIEEVVKNDKGLIVSHYFYDEAGKTLEGSYSVLYDNNWNIKEKKHFVYDSGKGKDVFTKTTYVNSFTDGKIKRAVITEKENVDKNDTVDYIRNGGGVVIEKRSHCKGNGTTVIYSEDGKTQKEIIHADGKLSLTRVFSYGNHGITSIIGTNGSGKEVEKLTWEYNDKGKLIKENRTYEDSGKNFSAIYTYNTKAQMSGEERVEKGVKNLLVYEYDDKGMISKISIKNEKAIRNNERTYTYE